MRNKSICIIGGAGFVGINIIKLLNNSNRLTVIDKGEIDNHVFLNKFKIDKYYNFDKSHFGAIVNNNFDYIFYLAGNSSIQKSIQDPLFDFKLNTISFISFLDKLNSKSTKIIYFSSAAVYGEMINNSEDTIPVSPYGQSKLSSEKYLQNYSLENGNRILICRPFSLFGNYCKKQVVYDTVIKLIKESDIVEIYDSDSIRDFIHINDALKVILMLCKKDDFRLEPYDIGTGISTNIEDLTRLISSILNLNPTIKKLKSVLTGNPKIQTSDIAYLDNLGFNFKYSLETRVRGTVEWIKNNYD